MPRIRDRLTAIAKENPLWDGRVVALQVVEAFAETIQLRALVSARNAPMAWDLRCEVREKLIEFLQAEHPEPRPRGGSPRPPGGVGGGGARAPAAAGPPRP